MASLKSLLLYSKFNGAPSVLRLSYSPDLSLAVLTSFCVVDVCPLLELFFLLLFLQEVMVNALLLPLIERVSDEDYVNQTLTWLVSYLTVYQAWLTSM